MADVTYSKRLTEGRTSTFQAPGPGGAYDKKVAAIGTITLAASASGTTVFLGRIPTSMRLLPDCYIYNGDLATSGSPTLDIGLASVESNITSTAACIHNGIALSATALTTRLFSAETDVGLPAWQIAGSSSDPGGVVDIYATVKDAATNASGTIAVAIYGVVD